MGGLAVHLYLHPPVSGLFLPILRVLAITGIRNCTSLVLLVLEQLW